MPLYGRNLVLPQHSALTKVIKSKILSESTKLLMSRLLKMGDMGHL